MTRTFQEFQMKHWLGKFWMDGKECRIALIGDRESVVGPLLEEILGISGDLLLDSTDEMLSSRYDVAGVKVSVDLAPALADAAGYKDEEYIWVIQGRMWSAHCYDLVIFCVNMSDTRLRGSVLRTFQELNTDWSRTIIILTFADALPVLVRHRDDPGGRWRACRGSTGSIRNRLTAPPAVRSSSR